MATRIREMAPDERPRERLLLHGAASLKSSELIAILLRTGTTGASALEVAEALLRRFGNLEALSRATIEEIAEAKGVGRSKAVHLHAAFALGARLGRSLAEERPLDRPEFIFDLLGHEMRLLDHEHVRVISVNARLRLLGVDEVSRGTLNESLFHAREVFRPAISRHAYGIILVHNHPSGDPAPSEADHRITRRLRQAGDTLDIPVLDHVILGSPAPHRPRPWFSFRECGALG